ncbi:MAG TPA: hypothetical protein IAA63_07825 [Candidatus Pullilachnospira stercoravium]|uniref:Uncharacterized protein n=1 Tax=Candidatus Pullilachnospira stercoravium TaxID=2840913 RepID=A0A9D1T6A9_9FIRM|nr:hypothetical protein [Candidatus Pullilachnospira stercoravium]
MTGYERIRSRIAWKAHQIQEHTYLTEEEKGELRAYADALKITHQEEERKPKCLRESFLLGILEGAGAVLGIAAMLVVIWAMYGAAIWGHW